MHEVSEHYSDIVEDMTILEHDEDDETVNQIKENLGPTGQLYAWMMTKKLINFQINCGVTFNIIPLHLTNINTQLEKTEKVLVMYNKTKQLPLGK